MEHDRPFWSMGLTRNAGAGTSLQSVGGRRRCPSRVPMTCEIRPVQGLLLAGVEGEREHLNMDAAQRNRNGLTKYGFEEATQCTRCRTNLAPVCRGGKDPGWPAASQPC